MKSSLLTRMERLELIIPVDDQTKRTTRILFVGSDESIEVKLSGHPSQRQRAQMTFHRIQPITEEGANS